MGQGRYRQDRAAKVARQGAAGFDIAEVLRDITPREHYYGGPVRVLRGCAR